MSETKIQTFKQNITSQIITSLATMILLLTTPVINILTINCILIITTLSQKIYWSIRLKQKPSPSFWLVLILKTIGWTSLFFLLWTIAGIFGIIGFGIFVIIIVAFKIYQGWNLFDTYTDWAAARIWGRTKEGFDFEKVITKDDTRRNEEQNISSDSSEQQARDERTVEESSSIVEEQRDSKPFMSKRQTRSSSTSTKRIKGRKRKDVQDLSTSMEQDRK